MLVRQAYRRLFVSLTVTYFFRLFVSLTDQAYCRLFVSLSTAS